MLILEILLYLANFCFLLVLGVLAWVNLLFRFFQVVTHRNELIVSFAPNFVEVFLSCKLYMRVFVGYHASEHSESVLGAYALFGNANEDVKHPMVVIVAFIVYVCVKLHQKWKFVLTFLAPQRWLPFWSDPCLKSLMSYNYWLTGSPPILLGVNSGVRIKELLAFSKNPNTTSLGDDINLIN
jgi:flagellar biosynthesis protein FliQ